MMALPQSQALGMAPGEHPFRIPFASATDRSPPLTPPKSWAWTTKDNGTQIGPPTLGGLRLLAKRPRRRRRERLQGFSSPFEIRHTGQTRSPALCRQAYTGQTRSPAKNKDRPLKTPLQRVINEDQLPKTWLV